MAKEQVQLNIAYADDHTSVRKGIIAFLERLGGINVGIQANNGKDLITQLEKVECLPDVIILDINMPEMDGFETMAIIKDRWPDLRVLILTIYDTELYIIRMIKLGANGYLLKNCDPEDIKQALMIIYKTGYYYSDAATSRFFNRVKTGQIKLPHFTNHEIDFLKYCPTDLSYGQIAEKLKTTTKAVEGYRDRICDKLQVSTRTKLAMFSLQFGIVHADSKMKSDTNLFLNNKKNT